MIYAIIGRTNVECPLLHIFHLSFIVFFFSFFQSLCLRRGLNPPHRVKSISMTTFSQQEVEFLQNHGNEVSDKRAASIIDSQVGSWAGPNSIPPIFHLPHYNSGDNVQCSAGYFNILTSGKGEQNTIVMHTWTRNVQYSIHF